MLDFNGVQSLILGPCYKTKWLFTYLLNPLVYHLSHLTCRPWAHSILDYLSRV